MDIENHYTPTKWEEFCGKVGAAAAVLLAGLFLLLGILSLIGLAAWFRG